MSLATNIPISPPASPPSSKALRTLINGNAADLAALTTTTKTNLVAALNGLKAAVDTLSAGSAGIDDTTTDTDSTYSSAKVVELLDALKDDLLGAGAATALDTIAELSAALGGDENAITAINTALGKRVRFDAAQVLTTGEKTQARSNIDPASATEVGDTTTNFVTGFEAGLV